VNSLIKRFSCRLLFTQYKIRDLFNAYMQTRGVTRGARRKNSTGAETLSGPQKVATISQVLSSIQYICFRKTSGSTMWAWRQTSFLPRAPSTLLAHLMQTGRKPSLSLRFTSDFSVSRLISAKLFLLWRVFVSHSLSFLSLPGVVTLVSCPIVLSAYRSTSHCLKQFFESV